MVLKKEKVENKPVFEGLVTLRGLQPNIRIKRDHNPCFDLRFDKEGETIKVLPVVAEYLLKSRPDVVILEEN